MMHLNQFEVSSASYFRWAVSPLYGSACRRYSKVQPHFSAGAFFIAHIDKKPVEGFF